MLNQIYSVHAYVATLQGQILYAREEYMYYLSVNFPQMGTMSR